MPEFYDVTTPLARTAATLSQEVTDRIAEYMQTEGAVLTRDSVIPRPQIRQYGCRWGRAVTRALLDPARLAEVRLSHRRSVSSFRQNATATHSNTWRANYCRPRPGLNGVRVGCYL
jgi:hypothetical protein